jgi:hypothetical protein
MSKNSALLLFGGLVVAVSFLGIPSSWKTIAFSILGASIIAMALFLRRDITSGALCLHLTEDKHTDSFKQNGALRDTNNKDAGSEKKDDEKENEYEKSTTEIKG